MKVIICYTTDENGLPIFEYGFSEKSSLLLDFKKDNKESTTFTVETDKTEFMTDDAYLEVVSHIENKA